MSIPISQLPNGQGINAASGSITLNSCVIGGTTPAAATVTTLLTNQTGLTVKGASANALTIKPNETLSAARTLNLIVNDVDRTVNLTGNLTIAGNLTTAGAFASTFTMTGTTGVTFPTSGTLATTAGNVATATALQNARTIGGVSFDGTANIVPQTIQSVNEASDTTCFPLFISASGTQSLQPLNSTALTFNASTGTLGATIMASPQGNFTGALIQQFGLYLKSTGAGSLVVNSNENLNADWTLNVRINNGHKILNLGGDLTTGAAFTTSGANDLTLTTTGATNVTLPTSGTLATVGGQAMATTVVTGTSQNMSVNNAYYSNNGSLVTFTLPASAAVGDLIEVGGLGAGGWRVAQNASQLIHLGSSVTTTGTGGRLDSTNQYDSVVLRCVVANTTFNVVSTIGNITVT